MVLGILIMLCIWQTVTLWLGDMSGLNFFEENVNTYEECYVRPKQIWTNINGSIYKIESSTEKEQMLRELVAELRKDNISIELSPKENYAQILNSTKGMVYEYGLQLTVDEIIGQALRAHSNKYASKHIQEMYVDLSEIQAYKAYVYLVDEKANILQKITLNSELKSEKSMISVYTLEENVEGQKSYQASILSANDSSVFEGNTFYPLQNTSIPIAVNNFILKPVITDTEGNALENYVNSLFKNPSYKMQSVVEGGIAYSDNLNVSVKYNLVGTLEFKRTLLDDIEKMTEIERISKAAMFTQKSQAIPEQLRKGLYLKKRIVDQETKEICYQYGYCYDNYEVLLSDEVKAALKINDFLELRIKNGEITGGKWIMMQPVKGNTQSVIRIDSNEAIESIYENSGLLEEGLFLLQDLECAYFIDDLHKESELEWFGRYKEQYISKTNKIGNG